MKKALLILLIAVNSVLVFGQNRIITGKITGDDNLPLPGVSVLVKGTTSGTTSNAQGMFSISAPASATKLIFKFIGYKDQELTITGAIVNVTMLVDLAQLNEVVVTGYKTQNKRETTGSVSSVRGEEISTVPIASFDQALQGKLPGVLVQAQSGQPGAAASVIIRGKSSVLGSIQPLYILDGVEVSAADFATLNQSDFEDISILKDAVSTSQYGSRGSNGVVVITSKKGKPGKARVSYDGQFGKSRAPENKLVLMTTNQKLDYEIANGNPNDWTDAEIANFRTINTDWEDVFFQTGTTRSHNLGISGASDKTQYFVSGSYFNQTGTVQTTKLKRYNGRANISSGSGNFDFGLNSTFGYSDFTNTSENNTGISTPLNAIRWTNPYLSPYNADGTYAQNPTGQPNPLPELLENRNLRGQVKAIANVYGSYKIPLVPGLVIKASVGGDYSSNENNNFSDPLTSTGAGATGGKGSVTRGYGKQLRQTLTGSINYDRSFGDHRIKASAINEVIKFKSTTLSYTGYGLGGPFENESGITPGNATNGFIPAVSGSGGENSLLGYIGLLNYGYKEKYFLELSVRRDGSSRFGANKQFANFASAGANWIVSDEDFMSGLKDFWINELKLKASYGSAGNQSGIGNFESREIYGRAVYNGVSGLIQTQLANPDLQWERKTTFNGGFEFTSLDNKLTGTVEYYNSITSDLFLNRQLSRTTGYSSLNSNIGELQNRGIETSLSGDIIKSKLLKWNINLSFTYNKSKVKKLVGDQKEIINGSTINRVGEQLNTYYLVRYVGVNPANGNAQYLDKDGVVTETYSPANRVLLGTAETPYFGGIGSSISFKGFDLYAAFTYNQGNKVFNNDRVNVENPVYLADNLNADLLTEWRKAGDITMIPRASQTMQSGTTRFLEDGSFVRLRNVSVTYTLPKKLLSQAKLNSAKLYIQGENLKSWFKFRGADPEISTGTLSGAQYPALRTVTMGINIGL